jgi:hypothetical protein
MINDDGNFYDYSTGMTQDTTVYYLKNVLISNFRHVLNVVCFLLGNSLASEFQMPGYYPEEYIQHKKHVTKLHVIKNVLYVHCKLYKVYSD